MKYVDAIREALDSCLEENDQFLILGQGVWSPFYVGSSMDGLEKKYGRERVIDTPVSENGVTALALGAAITGTPTLVIHPRMDFLILAMDAIVNAAAKWRYSLNYKLPIPFTVRAIINRGGEQGAQHSQALHSWFAHIPGLRVVMPSNPRDAYYLLKQSIESPDPVIFIEDRWSYELIEDFSQDDIYPTLDKEHPKVLIDGNEITVVGIGHTTNVIQSALKEPELQGKSVELIDLRVLQPINLESILNSVNKTKRLLIVDAAWGNCGIAGELIASVCEATSFSFQTPPARMVLPDSPAPTSGELEAAYYFNEKDVANKIISMLDR